MSSPCLWAVVPAAGIGSRMQSSVPKQYLKLGSQTVIETTLHKLLKLSALSAIVVTLSRSDTAFSTLPISQNAKVKLTEGGAERVDSVLAGLKHLLTIGAKPSDWVLVHDAARPCVRNESLQKLLSATFENGVGGILAARVADTLKRSNASQQIIAETLPRADIWQAHTPQCFNIQQLINSIEMGMDSDQTMTDEASAVELAGVEAVLVEDSRDNIKITCPEDLPLAEFILTQQQVGAAI